MCKNGPPKLNVAKEHVCGWMGGVEVGIPLEWDFTERQLGVDIWVVSRGFLPVLSEGGARPDRPPR